ncbi:FkbM family methyltransferase [Nocardioides terrisoli]|uniref:FkbM family methyltransferase n=1 Tax=Nocardioides terrisoli TaxID=3388267 RepID=UPI00287BA754|nr:FkbM family methyltransferase [Nocardioides marmorisolisilvae]
MEHNPDRLYRGPLGVVLEPFVRAVRGHGLTRRHRLVWWAHRAVWRLTRSNRVRLDGFELEVDLHDSLQLARGSYEPEEVAWYKEHVKPGDRVLELGANIGYFTCLYARLVGPDGRVVAYEPDPRLHAICQRNLVTNGFADRAEVRMCAVSDHPGRATFFRAGRNYGNNSLVRDDADALGGTSFEVELVRLDDDLADLAKPFDFVKMDIQGAESHALSGMQAILRDRPPRLMLLEFWPKGLVGMGRDPRDYLDQLAGAGYRVSELGSEGPVDVDSLLRRLTPENRGWTSLVCARD